MKFMKKVVFASMVLCAWIGAMAQTEKTGAPDKPCGGGHTDANSKTVAIRYMIENKLVPLHYES